MHLLKDRPTAYAPMGRPTVLGTWGVGQLTAAVGFSIGIAAVSYDSPVVQTHWGFGRVLMGVLECTRRVAAVARSSMAQCMVAAWRSIVAACGTHPSSAAGSERAVKGQWKRQ